MLVDDIIWLPGLDLAADKISEVLVVDACWPSPLLALIRDVFGLVEPPPPPPPPPPWCWGDDEAAPPPISLAVSFLL